MKSALGVLLFMGLLIAVLIYTVQMVVYHAGRIGVSAGDGSGVMVEEVYRDTRVSVYRLVDPANGVVCYWTQGGGGSMACRDRVG
jgi:hypothetical protein